MAAYDCDAVGNLLGEVEMRRQKLLEQVMLDKQGSGDVKDLQKSRDIAERLAPVMRELMKKGIPNYIDCTTRPRDWTKGSTRWEYSRDLSLSELEDTLWDKEKQDALYIGSAPLAPSPDGTIAGAAIFQYLRERKLPVLTAHTLRYLKNNPDEIPDAWKRPIDGKTPYIFFWGTVFTTGAGEQGVCCMHYNPNKHGTEAEKWDFTGIKKINSEWGSHDFIATLVPEGKL